MAECIDYNTRKLGTYLVSYVKLGCLALMLFFFNASHAFAQECTTTKECAQQMVELANDLKAENIALAKRIDELEAALAKQSTAATAALNAKFKTLRGGSAEETPKPGGNGRSAVCPKGRYMVGTLWQSDGGGPHGILSWISPICRKFP
jgi:hypothetical protein